MNDILQFLIRYGYAVLFVLVLAEQVGLPIPAVPVLLAMGALAGLGRFPLLPVVLVAVAAAVTGDGFWYALGRFRGRSVLNLLCRVTLEPDSCVRRTQTAFQHYGARLLLFAKFVPGLSTAAPPLAAMSRMSFVRFLLWDAAGALTWAGSFVGAGYLFRTQLENIALYAARFGVGLFVLLCCGLAFYLIRKYAERRKFLHQIRMARISPEELMRRIETGEQPFVADLRHQFDLEIAPMKIPGAFQLFPEDLGQRHHDIPRDRDIILYCSCPNEATSAHVALELRGRGISKVRPLAGGFEAWRVGGFPVEPLTVSPARPQE
ncbi:MAG: VTT domain-containing protein [Terriglobia bacterium]